MSVIIMSSKKEQKREKYFNNNKIKNKFENGSLGQDLLSRIPHEKQLEYLKKELDKKYKKKITFNCYTCACTALYSNRAISDEDLIKSTGLPHV